MIDVPPELLKFLSDEESRARDTDLDDQRAAAIDFYNGAPFGDEEDGRSQLVTRDVAEVIDHQVISILRTFISGDKVVEFEDDGEEQPAQPGQPKVPSAGQQATECVAYQFMRKQPGYMVLHDSLKAGLMEKTGIVKTWAEPQPPKHTLHHVHPAILDAIPNKVAAEPTGDPENDPWLVKVAHEQPPCIRDMAVPNEEFRISPEARDLDSALYLAHVTRKTLSDLVEMGFDRDDLADLGDSDTHDQEVAAYARDRDRNTWTNDDAEGPNRRVWLREEYVRWDINDDGVSELICVHRVGNKVLDLKEVEEQPFSAWSPFPMQHRFVGQSSADKTMDIQRTNSVLLRQAMDNLYQANAPRVLVHEDAMGENTVDDLLTIRPGALVRWKGASEPKPMAVPFTADKSFVAMEFMIAQRESRTGITRHNQGLNPDTLNKTASGMEMLQNAGDQAQEYVARNFAEMLVAPMFAKRYRMMRAHQTPFTMKIDGQRLTIDPRTWPEEIDMAIRVGLGSGRKEQRLQYRMEMLGIQQQAMMAGLPIVKPTHIYNSIKGLVADAALGNINEYALDPDSPEGQQAAQAAAQNQQQNPDVMKAQAQIAIQQQKAAHDAQMGEAKLQVQQADAAAKASLQHEKNQTDAQIEVAKAATETELAHRQQQADFILAQQKLAMEHSIKSKQADNQHDIAVKKFRAGGALDK